MWTSRSICCPHHQRCGTDPLFCSPCLHLMIMGLGLYVVCGRTVTVMYSLPPACSSHTLPTHPLTSGKSTHAMGPSTSTSTAYASSPSDSRLRGYEIPIDLPKRSSKEPTSRCRKTAPATRGKPNTSPGGSSFPQLIVDHLDVVIILHKQAPLV